MRFIYGKQNWAAPERGAENCYLLTNGLGGFSSAAMTGANTRNDHAFLMACINPPNHRYNMIHRLEEELVFSQRLVHLSSQEYVNQEQKEEGYRYLSCFCFEDYPEWTFDVHGVEVVKKAAMKQGENRIAVLYEIDNRTSENVRFRVTPHLQFVPKGTPVMPGREFKLSEGAITADAEGADMTVYYRTNGTVRSFPQKYVEGLYYAYDECDGRMSEGCTYTNHCVEKQVWAHTYETLEIIYFMEKQAGNETESADAVIKEAVRFRRELVRVSAKKQEAAKMLVKSAAQFVAERSSTGGKTILAGFPFFEDWGRDTMIAVTGCCICTGQFKTAKSILRTFAAYCRDGLMPNLFPEGTQEPQYNTVDAALLYINAVYLYMKKTQDAPFLEEVWPVMKQIVNSYCKGTAYGIHMDEDGLLSAGEGYDQVTWMDVRIGDILPTPRHGKPVEINAYWYNALCIMEEFARLRKEAGSYSLMAEKTKESFCGKFWNEKKKCLKDVLCGTQAEDQIRCNQIFAVSMPFTMLDAAKEKQVVDTVYEKLYTPYGLRTLEPSDREFHEYYGGAQTQRDLAYHQGTVWVFPLGAYYLAWLKTENYSVRAVKKVKKQLEVLESAMAEGCIGQLPEIYDGGNPSFSKGCFAQAWSVGEILRVYEALEQADGRVQ